MNLPAPLRKYADKIQSVSDERDTEEGYWVYLALGWRDPEGETHCIHEDTPGECARSMSHLQRCNAPGCCMTP